MPLGFPIQKSRDQRSFASFPGLIAGCHVFRRLSMPRHPPCTLSSLTTFTDHRPARAWRAVQRPAIGQIKDNKRHGDGPASCRPGRALVAKKVLDDPPDKTKRPCRVPAGLGPTHAKLNTGGSQFSVGAAVRRGSAQTAPQNLLLNLVFTCQRTTDCSVPAERGRDSRPKTGRRTRSSSAISVDHRSLRRPELCYREPVTSGEG
jgi:hypothetical protein